MIYDAIDLKPYENIIIRMDLEDPFITFYNMGEVAKELRDQFHIDMKTDGHFCSYETDRIFRAKGSLRTGVPEFVINMVRREFSFSHGIQKILDVQYTMDRMFIFGRFD